MKTLLTSLAIFALTTSPALAAEVIGTIVALEGTATASGKQITEDAPVHFGETIETGEDSKLIALLIDNTEITLGETSQLTVDEYVFAPEAPETQKAQFSILKGAFLLASGIVADRDEPDVTINTGVGSIGLRGTTVWGGPLDNEYGVLVQMGEVDVYNQHGKVTLYPGQGSFIPSASKSPRKIGGWDGQLIDRAVRMVTLADSKTAKEKLRRLKTENKNAVK